VSAPVPQKSVSRRVFRLVGPDFVPTNAMSRAPRVRWDQCRDWRFAIMQTFSHEARPIKIAWALESLSAGRGYAFPSDTALAAMCGLNAAALYLGLRTLEAEGFIARVHVATPSGTERRLFLLAVNPTGDGVGGSPSLSGKRAPRAMGTEEETKARAPSRARGGARDAARLAAENRANGVTFMSLVAEDEARSRRGRA
jgi:hypothetical protein